MKDRDRDVTNELRAAERRRVAALVARDMEAAWAFHAEDYDLVSGSGSRLNRDEYVGAIGSGGLSYARFDPLSEMDVRLYGDVGVVRYLVSIDVRAGDFRDVGHFWHIDLYERRDGRWQVVWSQATTTTDGLDPEDLSAAVALPT